MEGHTESYCTVVRLSGANIRPWLTLGPTFAHYAGAMPQSSPEPLHMPDAEASPVRTTLPLLASTLIGAEVGLLTALPFEPHWEKEWPVGVLSSIAFVWTAGFGAVFFPTARQRWGAVALGVVLGVFEETRLPGASEPSRSRFQRSKSVGLLCF